MSPYARQIGGIEISKDSSGTTYERRIYVPETELSEWMPEIGDAAPWASENAVVRAVSKTGIDSDAWLLRISAEEADADERIFFNTSSLDNFVEKSFSMADLYFPYDWWGIRIAGPDDTPAFQADNETVKEDQTKYKNIEGAWAVPGDYLYRNAVPLRCSADGTVLSEATAGSAVYKLSPFLDTDELPVEWIGQMLKTRIYRCAFNTRRQPQKIAMFCGISGKFANQCHPGGDAAGAWKALSQDVLRVRAANGTIYTHVTRTMQEAPGNLSWDADKNNGTWTW